MTYAEWIADNFPTYESAYGHCAKATEGMVAVFPELIRVRGHYYDLSWGEREHWWCKTADGVIVDPTAHQFPSKGMGHYEELDPNAPVPTGKCMGCGEYVYNSDTFCSSSCETAVIADLHSGFQ